MNKKQIEEYREQFKPRIVHGRLQSQRRDGTYVEVKHGNVEQALRKLKKKVTNSNMITELRERQAFIPKSTRRKKAKAAAKMRQKRENQRNQIHKKRLY